MVILQYKLFDNNNDFNCFKLYFVINKQKKYLFIKIIFGYIIWLFSNIMSNHNGSNIQFNGRFKLTLKNQHLTWATKSCLQYSIWTKMNYKTPKSPKLTVKAVPWSKLTWGTSQKFYSFLKFHRKEIHF